MASLIQSYYIRVSQAEAKQLARGQLCWGPALYLSRNLSTVELDEYNPRNENLNRYKVLRDPPKDVLFNHTPIHELHLKSNEELLVYKGKKRLLVVTSQEPSAWTHGGTLLSEEGFQCLPLYSFHEDHRQEFRARVQAHEYPWWIYLPEDQQLGMREGFLRLDRMQLVERSLLNPHPIKLSDDALYFVSEWLRYYVTGDIEDLFLDERSELLRQLGYDS